MSDEPISPEIDLQLSPHQKLPKKFNTDECLDGARRMARMIGAYLPDAMPLDGSVKMEIRLGDSGDEPRYQTDGESSCVYQEAFDFAAWSKAKGEARSELMLEAVAGILDRVAQAFRDDRSAIKNAVKQLKKAGYEARLDAPDLCTSTPPDAVGAELEVFRTLSRAGEEWKLEVRNAKGRVVRRASIGEAKPTAKGKPRFSGYEWQDTEYVLLGAKGRPAYRLDLSPGARAA